MKWLALAACLLLATAVRAGDYDYAAEDAPRRVSVFLVRPAELVAVAVSATSDADKPDERQSAVREARARLVAKARAGGLQVDEGPLQRRRGTRSSWAPDPASTRARR